MSELRLVLPADFVEQVARRAAEIVLSTLDERHESAADWLYGDRALAKTFGLPLGKVQKLSASGRLPHRRLGARKIYSRSEIEAWLNSEGRT